MELDYKELNSNSIPNPLFGITKEFTQNCVIIPNPLFDNSNKGIGIELEFNLKFKNFN